jgi:hypothetical protein
MFAVCAGSEGQYPGHHEASHPTSGQAGRSQANFRTCLRGGQLCSYLCLLPCKVSKCHRFDVGIGILCVIMRGTGTCTWFFPVRYESDLLKRWLQPSGGFLVLIKMAVYRNDQYCNFKPCWLGLSCVVDSLLFISDPYPDPWTRNPEVGTDPDSGGQFITDPARSGRSYLDSFWSLTKVCFLWEIFFFTNTLIVEEITISLRTISYICYILRSYISK